MVTKRPLPSRESSFEQGFVTAGRRDLQSLARNVSPPPTAKKRNINVQDVPKSAAAAIEAGEEDVEDHLAFYSSHLLKAIRPEVSGEPRLDHADWVNVYRRNADSLSGCHFVVHQHDHPVAGTHYDLRLQCNPTSSISFAIMYGLPGDPNSRRLNRNATETRVHCLWNHLIETASHSTGSMLIWDTGEYDVLPYHGEKESGDVTDSISDEDNTTTVSTIPSITKQRKLQQAFQQRKIKLRLNGRRLPPGYTLSLRLTKDNFRTEQPQKPSRRRRRQASEQKKASQLGADSDRDSSADDQPQPRRSLSSLSRLASPPVSPQQGGLQQTVEAGDAAAAIASDDEAEIVRANNAYTGATNDIGSIHQRKWYMSVDRVKSGFVKQSVKSISGLVGTTWIRSDRLADGTFGAPSGFDRFVVGGREVERSVVTGRLAGDILKDEGVVGYVPRGLWRAVTE